MFGKVTMSKTFAEQLDDAEDGKQFGQAISALFSWLENVREEEENESA
jgi:hypothetical protein